MTAVRESTGPLTAAVESLGNSITVRATVHVSTAITMGDERVCLTCRRRWGLNEDRPDCERSCNGD